MKKMEAMSSRELWEHWKVLLDQWGDDILDPRVKRRLDAAEDEIVRRFREVHSERVGLRA